MKRWVMVSAYVLGVLIVAEAAVLGYAFVNAPPEDPDNSYQRITVTDIEKGQTQDGVVTAEIRAEPYLYCPETQSLTFHIGASFYNGSERLSDAPLDPGGTGPVEVPTFGKNVTIPARNESLSPDTVDAIRALAVNRRDQGYAPCDEIAFPDELPPREYWWNSTDVSGNGSRGDNATET
jgi:hypothetical protein